MIQKKLFQSLMFSSIVESEPHQQESEELDLESAERRAKVKVIQTCSSQSQLPLLQEPGTVAWKN